MTNDDVAVGNEAKRKNVNNDNNVDTVTGAQLALRCLTDWDDRFTRAEIRNLRL